MSSLDEFVNSSAWLIKVSGAQRGRERHAAPAADAHGGRLARAQPPRPSPRPTAMELSDVPRHRPLAFDKMESLIKEMQDPESGVPVRSQKLFLTYIPSAFMANAKKEALEMSHSAHSGYDLVEWLMDRFNLDEQSNVEAINLANQLCQYGYFFPVNDSKNLVLKDDSSLYRFQSPYYWPWQPPRVGGSAPGLAGSDNVEYAIYLVKRTLRNKQRHGLEDHEVEALANLKKNLAAKWDFITMQAEEQVRLAKDRKKGDKIVSDSQERAYWRVARPPPGQPSVQETCPVPVRSRVPKAKKRTIQQITREIEHLNASLDRTRVKTSIALEALMAYSETFTPYDPWLTPPQPSNPWISDDTLYWQINSPLVEVPSEKRVQRWAISIDELVSDPTGLQEFTSFLRKEYSHENIRFWLAVMDLRRSSVKQIAKKLEQIYEEFLKPGAPCEINIDGATMDRVVEDMRTGSRYALDHAADHVYSLLLKKDCYPRFVRSDHFRRLLEEGKNVHQKKKFFNFGGGQVKKKPGSTATSGLSRRRGSDRSLSGSAHELAVCAAQPPRLAEPPPHSHSQSNLADIPFRDPMDDDRSDVAPWETSSRESSSYSGAQRRQDSAADSGSSSSDVSAAVCGERARRLPQQSTLDGGLRGAPPPLRRLSAVEPRHLAPLASPPRPRPAPAAAPVAAPAAAPAQPPHPTPTISVSSAPDDDSACEPPDSPDEPRSLAVSDEPSSVFASADATPTEPARTALRALEDAPVLDPATIEETGPASKTGSKIGDLPERAESVPGSDDAESSPARAPAAVPAAAPPAPAGPTPDSPAPVTPASPAAVVASSIAAVVPSRTAAVVPSSTAAVVPSSTAAVAPAAAALAAPEPPSPPPVAVPPPAPAPEPAGSTVPPTAPLAAGSAAGSAAPPAARPPEVAGAQGAWSPVRPPPTPVAPLAVGEDIGVDDDHVDKVPSAPPPVPTDTAAAAESDATKKIAHKDELSSVSKSNIVKRDNKSDLGDRKQRNDICPWEDENSCESDAPFVKTYATLGYL
ncbi:regulator of G-protein signaling 9 isoform X2 [Cydia strobilella]|uniref:regulator of G-protein signaling 9 isoform X2 n=1 Tax=Cydia strobilella TaxID=1100964 RepID=UPI0030067DF9